MPPYGGVATAPEPFADCVKSNGAPCTTLRAGDTLSRATAPFGPITVSVLSFRDDASTFLNTSHALEITYTYDLGGRSPNGYMLWSETVPNCGEYNPDGLSDGRGTTTTILSCPGVGGLTTTAVRLSIKTPDGSTVYSHDFPLRARTGEIRPRASHTSLNGAASWASTKTDDQVGSSSSRPCY